MCSLPYVYNFRFKEQEQQVLVDRSYVFSQKKNIFFLLFFFYCVQSFGFTQNFEISFCNSITASSFHFGIFRAQQICKIELVICTGSLLFVFFSKFRSKGSEFCGIYFLIIDRMKWFLSYATAQHTHFISLITHTHKITQSTASQIQSIRMWLNYHHWSLTIIEFLFSFFHCHRRSKASFLT